MLESRKLAGRPRYLGAVVAIAVSLCAGASGTAHAYIDPGTGSYSIQLIAAAIGGAALALRQVWSRLRVTLSGRRRSDHSQATSTEDDLRTQPYDAP